MSNNRHFPSWLDAYVEHTDYLEAPKIMHFWAGVWAIAGALRRKVWIDQLAYKWFPNFYIIFVAPPGLASKTTTAGVAKTALATILDTHFGPDVATSQSLTLSFANACEAFEYKDSYFPMSAISILSGEFGNLMDFEDPKLVNLFISLWDGVDSFRKETKTSGNDTIEGAWINMLACTTPDWIARNMHGGIVGGGFSARCIFIFVDTKEKFRAYPRNFIKQAHNEVQKKLEEDLQHISTLCGEYFLTPEAEAWGIKWYEEHWKKITTTHNEDWWAVYLGRKQTHLHKLAMVFAASQRNELIITKDDLILSELMLQETEKNYHKVFRHVNKNKDAVEADKLLSYIKTMGDISSVEAFKMLHHAFPQARDLEGVLVGLQKAGWIAFEQRGSDLYIRYIGEQNG